MGIATPSLRSVNQFLDNQDLSDSMSQDLHQNIFSFSNGFERSQQQQQLRRDNKLRTEGLAAPPLIGMEEDGLPSYESGGILSEMFNFSSGGAGAATELLETQLSQTYRNPRAAEWFLHRQGAVVEGCLVDSKNQTAVNDTAAYNHHQISSINADSAAAMQLFLMNPQQQRSPPSPSPPHPPPSSASSSLHMLLPHPSPSFHTGGAFGQFTFGNNPNDQIVVEGQGQGQGQGLSLSLSSSLEAAKAEELSLGEGGMLLFGQGGASAPAASYQFKNFSGGALHMQSQSQSQTRQLGLGPSFSGVNILSNSKYSKAAQDLLEEFCSVGRGLFKKTKISKQNHHKHSNSSSSSKDLPPLSASDRLEHQRRKVKLSSMLDEVDRRYNHYCEQMQMVVNSFDMIMGFGAAAPYTSLAQKAMSRHFRCLRDAISEQLKQSCEQLGEQDSTKSGLTKGETPRLKFLEQSLRQQRAFHQMGGMMEQEAWRPQRGLPERSVGILRAWLFEHFLNPYPSDADKHLLARQTGLSRSQVSNWFINARVRLWKPMVEEMYVQEAKDDSEEPNRDQTATATAQTPTPHPTTTTSTTAVAPAKRSEINVHENDPSFVSFNTSETHPNHAPPLTPSSAAPPAAMHDAKACRKQPAGIRFVTSSGDVSLTLGLRHAGNVPEKSSFSVRDFDSC